MGIASSRVTHCGPTDPDENLHKHSFIHTGRWIVSVHNSCLTGHNVSVQPEDCRTYLNISTIWSRWRSESVKSQKWTE
jgi:hypothetical protein